MGKMSPYLRVVAGSEAVNSPPCKKGHLTPHWESELQVPLNGTVNFLVFELYNKETFSKDDLIGSAQFSLHEVFNSGFFKGWVPLVWNGGDAGALFVEMNLIPQQTTVPQVSQGLSEGYIQHKPIFGQTMVQQQMSTEPSVDLTHTSINLSGGLEPIVHKMETIYQQEQPIIQHERPIVHEKTIYTEKPIITEKKIIYCEQPIIIEKPEMHERIIHQTQATSYIREEPIITRMEPSSMLENPNLYGAPIIEAETQYRKENPTYLIEQPELYQQKLITEKPIIHEKDIIHLEKPVIVERPEIHEKPIFQKLNMVCEHSEPVFTSEVSHQRVELTETPIIHSETTVHCDAPIFQKERAEIYETSVIHEKPIIIEKPIIYSEQEVVRERPEVHEKRIYHQEPVKIIQEETVFRHDEARP